MTTPQILQSILYSPYELKAKPRVTAAIIRLVNDAFYRSKVSDPARWDNTTLRFPNADTFHAMLTKESVIALIYDTSATSEDIDESSTPKIGIQNASIETKRLVACAAAVPWKGGWSKEGAGIEDGWEIKIVCVHGDAKYLKHGFAVQLLKMLEYHLFKNAKSQLWKDGIREGQGQLDLWILAAECINGVYWRKKGYEEVRRQTEGVGIWSCKTSFEMVVFRKIVTFDIGAQSFGGACTERTPSDASIEGQVGISGNGKEVV